jgi:hypothetical protein
LRRQRLTMRVLASLTAIRSLLSEVYESWLWNTVPQVSHTGNTPYRHVSHRDPAQRL